jgi:hypothetical protein
MLILRELNVSTSDWNLTCMDRLPSSRSLVEQIEQFPSHQRTGVCLLQGPALAHNVGCGVRALYAFVTRRAPPGFHILDLLVEKSVLSLPCLFLGGQELVRVGGECS